MTAEELAEVAAVAAEVALLLVFCYVESTEQSICAAMYAYMVPTRASSLS